MKNPPSVESEHHTSHGSPPEKTSPSDGLVPSTLSAMGAEAPDRLISATEYLREETSRRVSGSR